MVNLWHVTNYTGSLGAAIPYIIRDGVWRDQGIAKTPLGGRGGEVAPLLERS